VSRENVEIVRRVFDAAAQRDAATVLALYDPEVEWDMSRYPYGEVVARRSHGHEGLRGFWRELHEAWDDYEHNCQELIDAGDHVISVVTDRGRGRTSGAEVEIRAYGVWTIRDGKIVRVVWFRTREEALEAVGLRE
jgi:ketosteroid isomerase-like protein